MGCFVILPEINVGEIMHGKGNICMTESCVSVLRLIRQSQIKKANDSIRVTPCCCVTTGQPVDSRSSQRAAQGYWFSPMLGWRQLCGNDKWAQRLLVPWNISEKESLCMSTWEPHRQVLPLQRASVSLCGETLLAASSLLLLKSIYVLIYFPTYKKCLRIIIIG